MEKKNIDKKKNKSKSLVENLNDNNIEKANATFDFANLYPSAAETSLKTKKKQEHYRKTDVTAGNQNSFASFTEITPSNPKKNSRSELSKFETSTPNKSDVKPSTPKETPVKSIMKHNTDFVQNPNSLTDDSANIDTGKRKKRTKSVSFVVEVNEETTSKKPKSEERMKTRIFKNSKNKPIINNSLSVSQTNVNETTQNEVEGTIHKKSKIKIVNANVNVTDLNEDNNNKEYPKKFKKTFSFEEPEEIRTPEENSDGVSKTKKEKKKKNKQVILQTFSFEEPEEIKTPKENSDNDSVSKTKKEKKKKNKQVILQPEINPVFNEKGNFENKKKKKRKHIIPHVITNIGDANEDEPEHKSRKVYKKADTVVDDFENLSIGDNPHTLSELLDEMTFANKNKNHKTKQRSKTNGADSKTAKTNLEADEKRKKDKDMWRKRKLHKKAQFRLDDSTTSVIVDNLPLKILLDYKSLLREHFSKCGLIRRIGVAEVYPTENPKPVFATTVYFFSEEAATMALEEDNSAFQKCRIRVRRPLPPTETTLIVRCRSPLDESILSSAFLSCGRIRSIRKVEKSKKSMSSAFVEFTSPEEVENAMRAALSLRIGGKKVFLARFEIRHKNNESQDEDVKDEEIKES